MSKEDLSGRSRLVKNVGASYVSHFVFVIFGFAMPRFIDESIGQVALGIWDFGWSFVTYMNLAMIGIGGTANFFVAKYRAKGDVAGLNRIVSTVILIQLSIAVTVLLISIILAFVLPKLMVDQLGGFETTATFVIAGLGASLVVQMAFDVWRGVITGCHRWDYHNGINAVGYAVASIAMLIVLWLGHGLEAMVIAHFVATVVTELVRYRVARRVCPEVSVDLRTFNWKDARVVTKFGVKNILLGAPAVVTTQTVNFFIVAHLGPAALAVLARPVALIRHVTTLANKFSFVLTPTAGSLQSQGKSDEVRSFALDAARAGWLITVPPLIFLFVFGDTVVSLWMGPDYAKWQICAVLSAGYLLPISQGALLRVLVGLDVHGQIAKIGMIINLFVLISGIVVLSYIGWSVVRAAMILGLAAAAGSGLTVLFIGLKHLKVGILEYLSTAMLPGLILLVALGLPLLALRLTTDYSPLITLCLAGALTMAITVVVQRKDVKRIWNEIRK